MSKAKTVDPPQKKGKHTGYDMRDGKYFIAPLYRYEMDTLIARMRGIESVLKAIILFANENSAHIYAESMTLWKRLADDLGLNISMGEWQYDPVQGCIYKVKSAEPMHAESLRPYSEWLQEGKGPLLWSAQAVAAAERAATPAAEQAQKEVSK